jgi:uncharacterized membrane protein
MLHPSFIWLHDLLLVSNRFVHIVCSMLLVGGVLFFEFVVPLATADLREEQQLAVFGRAQWVFRRIVWFSVIGLLLTGTISVYRIWPIFENERAATQSWWLSSLPWSTAHALLAVVVFLLAFRITSSRKLLDRPVGWLRVMLVALLVTVFLASTARHVRLSVRQWHPTPTTGPAMFEPPREG